MKIGIDSYCYHRYFGDVYAERQALPARRWTIWDFLRAAMRLGVDGVSLEACYLPTEETFLARLRDRLDHHGLERVWAWGHPVGLKSGTDREAECDLVRHLAIARRLGAGVMRIVGGSRRTRPASWPRHRRQLVSALKRCLPAARDQNVVLAIENHTDLLADELIQVLDDAASPWLGVCLDTGNNLRMFEDPVEVAEKLAPWTRATHVKDLAALGGNPRDFFFWPSVPLGRGLIDVAAIVALLHKHRYLGLLAIEVDYLDPRRGDEHAAVKASVRYLRGLLRSSTGK